VRLVGFGGPKARKRVDAPPETPDGEGHEPSRALFDSFDRCGGSAWLALVADPVRSRRAHASMVKTLQV